MTSLHILKVNAFTKTLHGGNPAGVVLQAKKLTDTQMKTISKQLQVSETAYVFPSKKADLKVRFFSPNTEVDLCGHATIALFYTLAQHKKQQEKKQYTQETNVGILPVEIITKNQETRVMMTQQKPIFKDCIFSYKEIAKSLEINPDDIDTSLPKQLVSTGLFTLPIYIPSLHVLKTMKPNFELIKKICRTTGAGSIHVFSFETMESTSTYHARNFAPVYGVNEDPVTGTANGAVSCFLKKYQMIQSDDFICEQGDILGRPGRIHINLTNECVQVGGTAKIVKEYDLEV